MKGWSGVSTLENKASLPATAMKQTSLRLSLALEFISQMSFLRLLTRYRTTLAINLNNHFFSSLKTLPIHEIDTLQSLSTSSPNPKHHPILIANTIPNPFHKLPILHHTGPSYRLIHGGLPNPQTPIEPTVEQTLTPQSTIVSDQIAKDTDKLCKILSNNSGDPSSITSAALTNSGVEVSPALVLQVLKKLSNAGALALSFFRWAEKQTGYKDTTDCYNALIEALGKVKQFKLIGSLVVTMKSKGLLTRETFGLIIRRYARARRFKETMETFEKMERFGMKPELSDFNRLIDTLCKSKHVNRAQEVFDKMKKKRFWPDLKTYSILLEGWGQEKDTNMLQKVYEEMKDEGFEPDVVTYGIIINSYCKCRKYDEAINLYNEMEANKCKPSPHIYCSLVNGLGAQKRLSEAMEFFERSKASGFVPEIPTYNAVVGAYCWSGQFVDAYKVIDEMMKAGVSPNSRTFDIIIHHLMKLKRTKEAYSIFQKMSSKFGCKPCLNTYTIIASMFCNEQRVDIALKVWDQMKENGILPSMHMFSSLINGLCSESKLDDACKYFQEMLDMGIRPPGQLYASLKEALIDAGKKDAAVNLGMKLDEIRKTQWIE